MCTLHDTRPHPCALRPAPFRPATVGPRNQLLRTRSRVCVRARLNLVPHSPRVGGLRKGGVPDGACVYVCIFSHKRFFFRRAMSTSGCRSSTRRARRASSSPSFTRTRAPCTRAFGAAPRSPVSPRGRSALDPAGVESRGSN